MTWRTASSARSFRIEGWIFILIRAERETLKTWRTASSDIVSLFLLIILFYNSR